MSSCTICASTVKVAHRKHCMMTLCEICSEDTPKKLTREQFDRIYWGARVSEVATNVKREFYDDYKKSTLNVFDYIMETGA